MNRYSLWLFITLLFNSNLFSQEIEKNLKLVGIVSRDTTISSGNRKLILTVPEGRVWKVQNINVGCFETNGSISGSNVSIEVNGLLIEIYGSSIYSFNQTPLWLNSGDNINISGDKYSVSPVFKCRFLAFEYMME